MGSYIPTIKYVNLDEGFIKEPVKYNKTSQSIFTDSFGSGDKRERFVLVSDGGEEGGGLWVAEVLLLYGIDVREINKSKQYVFLDYMDVTRPMDMVHKTLGCVCERSSTDDEVQHSLRQVTGSLKKRGLYVESSLGRSVGRLYKAS